MDFFHPHNPRHLGRNVDGLGPRPNHFLIHLPPLSAATPQPLLAHHPEHVAACDLPPCEPPLHHTKRSAGEKPSSSAPAASKRATVMAPPASAAATAAALRIPLPSSATTLPSPPPSSGGGGGQPQLPPSRGALGRKGDGHVARASLGGLLGGVFSGGGRDDGEATRRKHADTVARINSMEPEVSALSDADLHARTVAELDSKPRGGQLDCSGLFNCL
ncbi:hypothetical protein ACP70R_037515 [Stipagrostis hirtigluma subsp. patula]